MTISITDRATPLYYGDGSTVDFPFSFKVFNANTDISIVLATEGEEVYESIVAPNLYTVTLNQDQENNPGGYATFKTAPSKGTVLRLESNIPSLQESELTNHGRFLPEILNDVHDKLTALIQQLEEDVTRCVIVPATSKTTREELLTQLLDTAAKANEYAELAKKTYDEVLATQKEIEDLQDQVEAEITQVANEQIDRVEASGGEQVAAVVAEADKQAVRLESIADFEESGHGILCEERVWTVTTEVEAETTITLPDYLTYVAGRNHIFVIWNGLVLTKDQNYSEVGEADTNSTQIIIHMPFHVGDKIMVKTVPLGRGLTDEIISRVQVLEDSLAELSRTVVYKSEETTE